MDRRHPRAASHAEVPTRHLPLPGRRPQPPRNVRPQAEAGRNARPVDAGIVHQRPAARPAPGSAAEVLRPAVRIQEIRPVGPVAVRTLPASRNRRRRHLRRPLDVHRADQPRPRPHADELRRHRRRPAQHGLLAPLRPRRRNRKPPWLCRPHLSRQRGTDAADRRPPMVGRPAPQPLPGGEAQLHRGPGPAYRQPGRHRP